MSNRITPISSRLTEMQVNLDDIRSHNRELADDLLNTPFDLSQAFDQALKNVVIALPNRPLKESSPDAVSKRIAKSRYPWLRKN